MNKATRVTVSAVGALAGLAGIEHGAGEILQGNVAPDGLVILSWPQSEAFRTLGGEPAMTVVPNLLMTGILATALSLVLLVWATVFVQRKHGGLVLILLSVALLLAGGGFGPPILGIIAGTAGTRVHAPLRWCARLAAGSWRILGAFWAWALVVDLIAWLLLLPGSVLLAHFFGVDDPILVLCFILAAFGFLPLAIFSGLARDAEKRADPHPSSSVVASVERREAVGAARCR